MLDEQKITFITCVNNEEIYAECCHYLERLYVPEGCHTDVVSIREAPSMTAGYNAAMKSSDARYKVYLHQDVRIKNRNFITDLLAVFARDEKIGMVGMVGTRNPWLNADCLMRWDTGKTVDNSNIYSFAFEKERYHISIDNICVYPQCYAAVVDRIDRFPEKQLAVDIGSWTVDIMPIVNGLPDESACVTQPHGIITCIQQINKECVRQLNAEVDEYDIQKVMVSGGGDLPEKYRKIIIKEIRGYCRQIYHSLRELGYNMDLTQIIFVGGGAGVMKRFGGLEQKNIQYIEDVKANARGYELLGNTYLAQLQKRRFG